VTHIAVTKADKRCSTVCVEHLARTQHCIPVWSASTSAPVWSDFATARLAIPGRKPGLQNLDF